MYKQAAALQHQFHDYTHASAHDPMANVLRNEIHHLTNDFATNQKPELINKRLETIQRQLRNVEMTHPQSMGATSPIMNHVQSSYLHNNFEQMRTGMRQRPHF
jgi:hypothetical protein